MDLKDFLKETLVQIASGVKEAQEAVRAHGGFVNPAARVVPKASDHSHLGVIGDGQSIFLVGFDVAVNVTEETKGGAEAKLKVASIINLGAGATTGGTSSATNRISFNVPLALPVDEESQKRLLTAEKDDARRFAESIAAVNTYDRVTDGDF
jgi:hypothetical protein